MLTLQIRTAVFPQIHSIKIPTCDDDTFRHMVLKKIIEVPVYIQYGFTRRLFGMPLNECRRYFSLIIVGEMPCRVFICFHIKKNQYILFCRRGTHPKKWRAKNHIAYVCRNFHPFAPPYNLQTKIFVRVYTGISLICSKKSLFYRSVLLLPALKRGVFYTLIQIRYKIAIYFYTSKKSLYNIQCTFFHKKSDLLL